MKTSHFIFSVISTALLLSCSDGQKNTSEAELPAKEYGLPDSLNTTLLVASFIEETPGVLTVLAFTDETRSTLTRTRYAKGPADCDTLQALGSKQYRASEGGVEYVVHDAYVVVSSGNAPPSSTHNCNITVSGLASFKQYPRNDRSL
jgi:hypothetical protein